MTVEFDRIVDAAAQELMSDRPDLLERLRAELKTGLKSTELAVRLMSASMLSSPSIGYRGARGAVLPILAEWRAAVEADEMTPEEALARARSKLGIAKPPMGARQRTASGEGSEHKVAIDYGVVDVRIAPPDAVVGRGFDLWESKPIAVGDLLVRMAESLHSDPLRRAAALSNLREEVGRLAVQNAIPVRNPLSMERLDPGPGEYLWRSVLFPEDAQRFAAEHGVRITIRPQGTDPIQGDSCAEPAAEGPWVDQTEPAASAARPLTTRKLAEAFNGIGGRDANGWAKLLGDASACQWAHPARLERGARGKRPAAWNPVTFALLLERLKDAPRLELRRRFRREPLLAEWREEWGRRIAELEAFGLDANDRQP